MRPTFKTKVRKFFPSLMWNLKPEKKNLFFLRQDYKAILIRKGASARGKVRVKLWLFASEIQLDWLPSKPQGSPCASPQPGFISVRCQTGLLCKNQNQTNVWQAVYQQSHPHRKDDLGRSYLKQKLKGLEWRQKSMSCLSEIISIAPSPYLTQVSPLKKKKKSTYSC